MEEYKICKTCKGVMTRDKKKTYQSWTQKKFCSNECKFGHPKTFIKPKAIDTDKSYSQHLADWKKSPLYTT